LLPESRAARASPPSSDGSALCCSSRVQQMATAACGGPRGVTSTSERPTSTGCPDQVPQLRCGGRDPRSGGVCPVGHEGGALRVVASQDLGGSLADGTREEGWRGAGEGNALDGGASACR